jgi:hypothetical protein
MSQIDHIITAITSLKDCPLPGRKAVEDIITPQATDRSSTPGITPHRQSPSSSPSEQHFNIVHRDQEQATLLHSGTM